MKIALAQLNYHIGNFERNTQKIKASIAEAREQGAALIVFSELSICGYPPLDLLESADFINACEKSLLSISKACVGIAALVGSPIKNELPFGKGLYNAAVLLQDGKIIAQRYKTHLPTYDVFDEQRYFDSNTHFEILSFGGLNIALTICEDLWNISDKPLYSKEPMNMLAGQNADFILNMAASPFSVDHDLARKITFKKNATTFTLPILNVNQVGANTDLIFDGGSLVYSAAGELLHEMSYFEEDISYFELQKTASHCDLKVVSDKKNQHPDATPTSKMHDALVLGIRDYFEKSGFKKAVLGLSGGVDSALTVALAAAALGANNVHTLLMPSQFSSEHSIDDSLALCSNLGISYDIIDIRSQYDAFLKSLHPIFADAPFGLAEENLQARIRGVLLMAYSNKFGHLLLNTSNKSELAVGYGTLYGDMAGGLSVLGDVYKTDVYAVCQHINKNSTFIPINIIQKAPSAELRPDQKDTDSLPEYAVLDAILKNYIEGKVQSHNHPQELVKKIIKLVNASEYKRFQAAPILRISSKAFGSGRQMPLVAKMGL